MRLLYRSLGVLYSVSWGIYRRESSLEWRAYRFYIYLVTTLYALMLVPVELVHCLKEVLWIWLDIYTFSHNSEYIENMNSKGAQTAIEFVIEDSTETLIRLSCKLLSIHLCTIISSFLICVCSIVWLSCILWKVIVFSPEAQGVIHTIQKTVQLYFKLNANINSANVDH